MVLFEFLLNEDVAVVCCVVLDRHSLIVPRINVGGSESEDIASFPIKVRVDKEIVLARVCLAEQAR